MTINIFKDYNALSLQAAAEILEAVKSNPAAVLCLAAGDTPKLTYALLAEKAKDAKVNFSKCTFVGLDEWVGISPDNPGSCQYFLRKNLFIPLGIAEGRIHLFNGLTGHPPAECSRMNRLVADQGGIDFMLVGVGMNGHIGFNEPGAPVDGYAHVVDLDSTTQSVGQKYFTQSTKLQQGVTLGLKHVLESRMAILLASGKKKADVISKALEGPLTPEMPASVIRRHPNGIAMLDEDAAALLQGRG